MKTPPSPESTIEREAPHERIKMIDQEEELEFDSPSLVELEIAGNELQMFSDLSDLVQSLEHTLDTVTITSVEVAEVHYREDADDDDDDDDDLEHEWAELSRVEGLVRKELEQQKLRNGIETKNEENHEHTLYDHFKSLKLQEVKGVGFVCDKSQFLNVNNRPARKDDCFELCQPVSNAKLATLYYGLDHSTSAENNGVPALPFRTLVFRLRPDKLSGAVMDSVCNAVTASSSDRKLNLLKRQGGHLRAVVLHEHAPYVVDAQLCIKRSGNFQRQLLLRLYYATPKELEEADITPTQTSATNMTKDLRDAEIYSNSHLKEACSLIQLMHRLDITADRVGLEKPFSTFRRTSYEMASSNLRTQFRKSDSVNLGKGRRFFKSRSLLLPALSHEDWLPLQSSWKLVENVWDGLAASFVIGSLESTPVERNNQIPCLDNNYCMELFRLSEERLFDDLEQAKADLRAHEARGRYISTVFTEITKPMFEMYNLSQVEELQETHSDFDVPNFRNEDNGSHIFVSLATKALASSGILHGDPKRWSSENVIAEEAIHVAFAAFRGYHVSMHRRLVKYMSTQVQKTLYRYRFCIHETYKRLKNAYQHSQVAIEESKKFLSLVQQSELPGAKTTGISVSPFLKCSVEGGDLYISDTHLLLFTNKLFQQPRIVEWFYQSSTLLFPLSDITVRVLSDHYLQVLNIEGDEIVQFRPFIEVEKLNLFISLMCSLRQQNVDMVGLV